MNKTITNPRNLYDLLIKYGALMPVRLECVKTGKILIRLMVNVQ